jgi:hypothetical protein
MSSIIINGRKAKHATIEAVINRADGTVEHLGVVSYYHRNPFKRWAWHVRRWLGI